MAHAPVSLPLQTARRAAAMSPATRERLLLPTAMICLAGAFLMTHWLRGLPFTSQPYRNPAVETAAPGQMLPSAWREIGNFSGLGRAAPTPADVPPSIDQPSPEREPTAGTATELTTTPPVVQARGAGEVERRDTAPAVSPATATASAPEAAVPPDGLPAWWWLEQASAVVGALPAIVAPRREPPTPAAAAAERPAEAKPDTVAVAEPPLPALQLIARATESEAPETTMPTPSAAATDAIEQPSATSVEVPPAVTPADEVAAPPLPLRKPARITEAYKRQVEEDARAAREERAARSAARATPAATAAIKAANAPEPPPAKTVERRFERLDWQAP